MISCSLKVEAPGSSEVLVTTYQIACCLNPEDYSLNAYFEIAHEHTRGKPFHEDDLMKEVILSAADSTSSQVSPYSFLFWHRVSYERGRYLCPSEYDSKNTFLSKKLSVTIDAAFVSGDRTISFIALCMKVHSLHMTFHCTVHHENIYKVIPFQNIMNMNDKESGFCLFCKLAKQDFHSSHIMWEYLFLHLIPQNSRVP